MQIGRRDVSYVTLLKPEGKLTLGEGTEELADAVRSLVNAGRNQVILDLSQVPYMDSAGLQEITRAYTTLTRAGGRLVLLNVGKRLEDLLRVSRLITVFEIFASEQGALASFTSATSAS